MYTNTKEGKNIQFLTVSALIVPLIILNIIHTD